MLQTALRVLPEPVTGAALQPAMDVPPSLKLTLPVGATPATVAVNVTLLPAVITLAEVARVVVPPVILTTCDSAALLEALFAASPP